MTNSLGTALVTGASFGIGAVYADRLAKRGYDLILVARNGEKLKSLASRLTSETGRSVKVIPADLGDRAALAKVESVLRDDKSITLLVNNAGTAALTPLLDSNVDQMEAMIALNVTALTRLTYAVAPAFVARGGGTIVNIGSVVGVVPERLNGVYGATKAYVLALDSVAAARTRRERRPYPGGAACGHSHGYLGEGGPPSLEIAHRHGDVDRGHGRRGLGGPRPGRSGDNPPAPGWGRLDPLRRGALGARAKVHQIRSGAEIPNRRARSADRIMRWPGRFVIGAARAALAIETLR